MNNSNIIWIGLVLISIVGAIFLIKAAYSNPLDLPSYAFKNKEIKESYEFAKFNPVKLEGLPCNCGCMSDADNHNGRLHSRGLLDCFIDGELSQGGAWESHASECGLCYEDALIAKKAYEEGKTKEEIETLLKEKYKTQTFSDKTVWEEIE